MLAALVMMLFGQGTLAATPAKQAPIYLQHERYEHPRFGKIILYIPRGPIKNLAIFASGDTGWASPASDMARNLGEDGTLVVGFSTPAYLKKVASESKCINATTDLLHLVDEMRTKFNLEVYMRPMLFGYSTGATFAFATSLQQENRQFRGAVGAGFCPDLDEAEKFCKVGALAIAESTKGFQSKKMFTAGKAPLISFTAFNGENDRFCKSTLTSEYFKSLNQNNIEMQLVPGEGHSFATEQKWKPNFLKLLERVSRQ